MPVLGITHDGMVVSQPENRYIPQLPAVATAKEESCSDPILAALIPAYLANHLPLDNRAQVRAHIYRCTACIKKLGWTHA